MIVTIKRSDGSHKSSDECGGFEASSEKLGVVTLTLRPVSGGDSVAREVEVAKGDRAFVLDARGNTTDTIRLPKENGSHATLRTATR